MLLDAGCGRNVSSLSYVPNNVFVIGVDISRWNISESNQKAKKKGYKNFNFVVASLKALPFRQQIFDLAVCVDVLEHIPNNQEAIDEISRVCKSRASFIGSTSNIMNPLLMFDSFAPKSMTRILTAKFAGIHYERHCRLSFNKLIRILNHSGFQVCDAKLLGFPPFQPWLYEFSDRKIPFYAYVWIVFNKLTEKKTIKSLKRNCSVSRNKKGLISHVFCIPFPLSTFDAHLNPF